jgi:hypothetical protein
VDEYFFVNDSNLLTFGGVTIQGAFELAHKMPELKMLVEQQSAAPPDL